MVLRYFKAIHVEMSKRQLGGIIGSCSGELSIQADCSIIAVMVVDTNMEADEGV